MLDVRKSTRKWRKEKLRRLATWLNEWQYITPEIAARLFGGNSERFVRNTRGFLEELEKLRGLRRSEGVLLSHPRVVFYTFGPQASCMMVVVAPPPRPSTFEQLAGSGSFVHGMIIRYYVAGLPRPLEAKRPPRVGKTYVADARLDRNTILELELSTKAKPRVYRVFLEHILQINAEAYSHVRYVFKDPRHAASYRALFEAEWWPEVIVVGARRTCSATGEKMHFPLEHAARQAFSFVAEADLWPLMRRPAWVEAAGARATTTQGAIAQLVVT